MGLADVEGEWVEQMSKIAETTGLEEADLGGTWFWGLADLGCLIIALYMPYCKSTLEAHYTTLLMSMF